MLNDSLNHTDREEGWNSRISKTNGMQNLLSKIDATVSSLALDALSAAFILCLIAFSV